MDNVPPPPDSPYATPAASELEPPPPPTDSTLPRLPWEERHRLGIPAALFETVKLFIASPVQAYARMREQGDVFEALLFYVLLAFVVGIVSLPATLMQSTPDLSEMPPAIRRWMELMTEKSFGARLIGLFLGPALGVVMTVVVGLLVHLGLLVVGALERSRSGIAGTLRVMAYASSASLAAVIPIVGPFIGGIWSIVLWILGARRIHNTTTGKATLGVLLLFLVCCLCAVLVAVLGVAAIVPFLKG